MAGAHSYAAARAASKKRKLAAMANKSAEPAPIASTSKASAKAAAAPKVRTTKEVKPGSLSWKSIVLPSEFGFDEDGGLLELDEVEGVDVVYGDGMITFRVNEEDEASKAANDRPTKKQKKAELPPPPPVDDLSSFPEEDLAALQEDGWIVEAPEDVPEPVEEVVEEVVDEVEEAPAKTEEVEVPKKAKAKKEKGKGKEKEQPAPVVIPDDNFDVNVALPAWSHLSLPTPIFRSLAELKFDKPTEIQERALSVEIGAAPYVPKDEPEAAADEDDEEEEWGGIQDDVDDEGAEESTTTVAEPFKSVFPEEHLGPKPNVTDRDIVGVAQTGSGKTLAYGLPILSYLLSQPDAPAPSTSTSDTPSTRLAALILAPTRELALQVRAAISEVAIRTNQLLPEELQDPNKNAPRKRVRGKYVSVVALTGGMSVEKQKRQLSRGADILVATPGRLWDLIGENDELARAIKGIKFLVIDEADRMIENGHFAELENIVRLTRRKNDTDENTYVDDFTTATSKHSHVDTLPARPDMRTFVFSATMSKDLQRNLKRNRRVKPGQPEDGMSSLDDLLLKLDFRDEDPEIIDLSPEGGLSETLKECKIECMMPEKDAYLYHFLLRYPGRTIVFLSSIDGIRRLHPLLVLLGLNAISLHSGMQQRARLKALDKFKTADNAVLLATDVAARGLDIPAVSHVVHYQLPRSADVYVHRSGRTARAGQEGLALQLCAPDEKHTQRLIMASIGKDVDLPVLPVDFTVLDKLKERIELAKKIESSQHKATKEAHEDNWLKQAAEALEVDLDSDMDVSDGENSGGHRKSRKKAKGKAGEVKELKAKLQAMLDKPIVMRGVSAKYITTRGRVDFVNQLVDGTNHSGIMGVEQSTALADLPKPKQKGGKAKK
ncbi:DEAD (asp-glu-ala-asp) box containing, RNA helicase [Pseudohyphozyma bogoriensis]|nr:DEAD (asp-glu-ala-asp) box containing, RNA helicase [Pseudohyphozyma bogoriensis]